MASEEDDVAGPANRLLHQQDPIEEEMKDKYHLAFCLFYAMGTLTLVPMNFFITANDYWMYKFRDPNNDTYDPDHKTGMQAEFSSDYTIVSTICMVAFLVVTIFLAKRISIVPRLIGALFSTLFLFALTVTFAKMNTDTWQKGFFILTMIIGALFTATGSMFIVTLFQLSSKFPPRYLAATLTGQAICGIVSALIQIFVLGTGASSTTSGLVYFLIGMLFVVLTLVYLIFILKRSEYFNHHLNKPVVQQENMSKITKQQFIDIVCKIKFYILSMTIVLGCTVMVNPGVTSLVQSVNKGNGNKWNDTFFVPTVTFLFFHLFDFVGRELAGKWQLPTNGWVIMGFSICRIIFVPMIMLCNALPRSHLPVVFDEDWAYIIFIIIFSSTNGFLVNLCVIEVPRVTTEDEKNVATMITVVFMIISLGACSSLSTVLVKSL